MMQRLVDDYFLPDCLLYYGKANPEVLGNMKTPLNLWYADIPWEVRLAWLYTDDLNMSIRRSLWSHCYQKICFTLEMKYPGGKWVSCKYFHLDYWLNTRDDLTGVGQKFVYDLAVLCSGRDDTSQAGLLSAVKQVTDKCKGLLQSYYEDVSAETKVSIIEEILQDWCYKLKRDFTPEKLKKKHRLEYMSQRMEVQEYEDVL